MATTKSSKGKSAELDVVEFQQGVVDFCILGQTPVILNRMSEKVHRELLLPKGRKTAAEKAGSLKHNPYQEFRDSPYINPDPKSPTYIEHLAVCFKKAICGAALDMPGANKSQLGRLLQAEGERVPIYGEPRLFMSVTRSADMNRTPDVRTRAIIPEWACVVSLSFTQPILNVKVVANLLAAAGITQGLGDYRPQKGSGNYGQFKIVAKTDKEFQRRLKVGRAQQFKAMQNPIPYDQESEELLAWFDEESDRRGFEVVKSIDASGGGK